MFKPLITGFVNLSIGGKLLLGFGLMCLLTLLVAGGGLLAMQSIVEQSTRIERMAQINMQILHARGAEKDYALKHDIQAAQQVRAAVIGIDYLLGQGGLHVDIRQAAAAYQQQFEAFQREHAMALTALQRMQSEAAKARVSSRRWNRIYSRPWAACSTVTAGKAVRCCLWRKGQQP